MREDEEEYEARKKRMDDLAVRIGSTDSGDRFLARIYEIGRAKPLRSNQEESEPDE